MTSQQSIPSVMPSITPSQQSSNADPSETMVQISYHPDDMSNNKSVYKKEWFWALIFMIIIFASAGSIWIYRNMQHRPK